MKIRAMTMEWEDEINDEDKYEEKMEAWCKANPKDSDLMGRAQKLGFLRSLEEEDGLEY
eukprot:SAG31_NODE_2430_length_5708_cov_2.891246_5_plen_59_part_00